MTSTSGTVAEVGIIGAGVHGAAVAFGLARRGVHTAVFERGRPAGGPTGSSSGICRAYYTNPFLARAARDSIAFLAEFADRTGGQASGYVRTGGLYLHGPADAAEVSRTAATLAGLGVEVEVLDPAALAERFPTLDLTGVGVGVVERRAGHADPYRTTGGLLTAARARGVRVQVDTPVVRVREEAGHVVLTTADGTTHQVERLLLAAGPWTAQLTNALGVRLPLHAERHIVALLGHSEPAGRLGRAGWADLAGSAPDDPGVIIDVAGGYYAVPQPRGRMMVGGLDPTAPADPDAAVAPVGDEEFALLADAALRRRPDHRPAHRAGGWSALYDVSADWQPVIGQVTERVWVDAGTSGHGFKLAPALGDHIAGALAGEDPDPGLAAFHPDRFTAGHALAAGFGTARILG